MARYTHGSSWLNNSAITKLHARLNAAPVVVGIKGDDSGEGSFVLHGSPKAMQRSIDAGLAIGESQSELTQQGERVLQRMETTQDVADVVMLAVSIATFTEGTAQAAEKGFSKAAAYVVTTTLVTVGAAQLTKALSSQLEKAGIDPNYVRAGMYALQLLILLRATRTNQAKAQKGVPKESTPPAGEVAAEPQATTPPKVTDTPEAVAPTDANPSAAEATAPARLGIIDELNAIAQPHIKSIQSIAQDAQVGFRGSLARGMKGPHRNNALFDPNNFDVDAFIVSDSLAAKFPAGTRFRMGDAVPEIAIIQKSLDASLRKSSLFGGLRQQPFAFRIFTRAERDALLNKGDTQIIFVPRQ